MLLKPLLNTASFTYNIAYSGLEWAGVPLTKMGNAVQSTASGYSLFGNTASTLFESTVSVFGYQPDSFMANLAKHVAVNTFTTAASAIFAGTISAGGFAAASPLVLGSAVITSATLFALENFVGREAKDYTGAYLQHGTAGVALEATTKIADYGMSFTREDWDQNYITNAKNIALSIDSLAGVIRGEKSYFGGYMKTASKYLNGKIYDFLVNNSLINAAFDLYAAYKLIGLAGLFTTGLTNSLETGHQANIHTQLLEDIKLNNYNQLNQIEATDASLKLSNKELQHFEIRNAQKLKVLNNPIKAPDTNVKVNPLEWGKADNYNFRKNIEVPEAFSKISNEAFRNFKINNNAQGGLNKIEPPKIKNFGLQAYDAVDLFGHNTEFDGLKHSLFYNQQVTYDQQFAFDPDNWNNNDAFNHLENPIGFNNNHVTYASLIGEGICVIGGSVISGLLG